MNLEDTNEQSLLETMRDGRKTANSIFVKFTDAYKDFPNYAFCFYEGEDGKYYNSRIEKYFPCYLAFPVGNKKEVLKLLNKIKSENFYDSAIKMFFIDRDYDETHKNVFPDLYETPCYSIENLYTTTDCFERILQGEFSLNKSNPDYNKCILDFTNRVTEFSDEILEFNALILLRRKLSDSNSNFQFGSIKTNRLVKSSITQIIKSTTYNDEITKIISSLNFTKTQIDACKEELSLQGHYSLYFRGKNQLDCVVSIIKDLIQLNSCNQYFSEKMNCVHLNITQNRLSELSQYATTPICLCEFLKAHVTN